MQRYIIIGISDTPRPFFPPEVMEIIRCGYWFSGGKRHHEIMQELLPADSEWIDISVPLETVFQQYDTCFQEKEAGTIIVFASGDPLFFGFANTVCRLRPYADIQLYPAFNSLQMLAHRLVLPYHDMRMVSLTGRSWQEFDRALIEHTGKLGVLTDRTHTPDVIAKRMLTYGYNHYEMTVGEHMGNPKQENIVTNTLEELSMHVFEHPNCLILVEKHLSVPRPRWFGIPDDRFHVLEGRPKMITKMPIRMISLQTMDLYERQVMWDVGFCTGSMSIEARLLFPHLQIFSFEIRPECKRLIELNCRQFGAPGIRSFIDDFITCDVSSLPSPDAVFIGGHGGRLGEMFGKLHPLLNDRGCIVMNAVSLSSKEMFDKAAHEYGMTLSPAQHITLNDYNPIYILKATK